MRIGFGAAWRPSWAFLIAAALAVPATLPPLHARAADRPAGIPLPTKKPPQTRPGATHKPIRSSTLGSRLAPNLDRADEISTLSAIGMALDAVGDGDAFMWHRGEDRLRGLIRVTTSFKARDGSICRHLVVRLASPRFTRATEGIACQGNDGGWSLGH